MDISAAKVKGVPLDSGLATPGADGMELSDPFEEFNSVTLHHGGHDVRDSED